MMMEEIKNFFKDSLIAFLFILSIRMNSSNIDNIIFVTISVIITYLFLYMFIRRSRSGDVPGGML